MPYAIRITVLRSFYTPFKIDDYSTHSSVLGHVNVMRSLRLIAIKSLVLKVFNIDYVTINAYGLVYLWIKKEF